MRSPQRLPHMKHTSASHSPSFPVWDIHKRYSINAMAITSILVPKVSCNQVSKFQMLPFWVTLIQRPEACDVQLLDYHQNLGDFAA